MANFQETKIIGRIGRDPEVQYTPSGTQVLRFSVAVDRRKRAGEDEPKTDWYRVNVWGQLSDVMIDLHDQHGSLAKGNLIFVNGRLEADAYLGNDGTARVSLDLHASDIQLLSPKRQG